MQRGERATSRRSRQGCFASLVGAGLRPARYRAAARRAGLRPAPTNGSGAISVVDEPRHCRGQNGGIESPFVTVPRDVAAAPAGRCEAASTGGAAAPKEKTDRPVWDAGAASGGFGTTHRLRDAGSETSVPAADLRIASLRPEPGTGPARPSAARRVRPNLPVGCSGCCRLSAGRKRAGHGSRSRLSPASTRIGSIPDCVQPATGGSD